MHPAEQRRCTQPFRDLQRSAHLDLGTTDRVAETERHLALGARIVAEVEFWTVLADPAGLAYCITDRDPATGELA